MFLKAAVLIALLAAPSALAAEGCPATVADAAKGVTIAYADGSTSVLELNLESGVVTDDWTQPGQPTYRNILSGGLHLVTLVDVTTPTESGGIVLSDYRFASPPPAFTGPGQTWDISYDLASQSGNFQGRYTGKVGAETTLQIGACTYAAFPVTITLIEPAASNLVKVEYVPSLGFGILRGYGGLLGDFTALTPVSISLTAKP